MKNFDQLVASEIDPDKLREQLATKGYVLIRDLLPREDVDNALTDVSEVLFEAGWLDEENDPRDRIPVIGAAWGDPDPQFKSVYQKVFNLESLHRLPHLPALRKTMEILAGEQVLVHPKPIGRLIFPNCDRLVTHAHQDYEFMGGDPEFYTVWIPLHDCPLEVGPLRILEGSHRHGVQHHEHEDLHVPEIPENIAAGDGWVGGQVDAGGCTHLS